MSWLSRLASRTGLRRYSSEADAGNDTLTRWLQKWMAVPRVVVPESTDPPTALSWLRRRGPPLPESALHKLFRQETVRMYDPAAQKVGRVSKGRALPPGAMLLLPKAAVAAAAGAQQAAKDGGSSRSAAARQSPAAQQQRSAAAAALRDSLLHVDRDWLAVSKPAGLATQGGRGVAVSVDDLMGEAFAGLPGVDPAGLRLVHRLDRHTTGVLLIARSPDAAAWLSAAFRDGSSGNDGGSSGSRSSRGSSGQGWPAAPTPASIRKTYWAVVARSSSDDGSSSGASAGRWLPPAGTISLPVPSSRDPGQLQEALTRYRVLHQSADAGLAWLQLEPSTGRKHQLRLHCARGLGAPVLGDARYGAVRSAAQEAALAALELPGVKQAAAAFGGSGAGAPLFLHCRSLEVRQPGARRGSVAVTAPLPPAWRALLQRQGWPSDG